jgi:hypothetical protein
MRHLALLRGVNVGGARSDANTTLPLWMTVAAAADGYAAASRDVRPTARRDINSETPSRFRHAAIPPIRRVAAARARLQAGAAPCSTQRSAPVVNRSRDSRPLPSASKLAKPYGPPALRRRRRRRRSRERDRRFVQRPSGDGPAQQRIGRAVLQALPQDVVVRRALGGRADLGACNSWVDRHRWAPDCFGFCACRSVVAGRESESNASPRSTAR